ncbi:MAG: HD domain-containing protein [bacterium]|nr:HD domain-containing protein [bacterium]
MGTKEEKSYNRSVPMEQELLSLGRKYHFDEQHARHVTQLALQLFDQLREVHGLGEEERRWLEAAGWLHDIGQYIAYRGHHKHSYYLIMQADLGGYDERARAVIAAVARYHRKGGPRGRHAAWKALGKRERGCVAKLAAILRIADAFDRCHAGTVREVQASVGRGRVELKVAAAGPLAADAAVLARKTALFREVFGQEVVIRTNHEE